jgi:hypothetical protein
MKTVYRISGKTRGRLLRAAVRSVYFDGLRDETRRGWLHGAESLRDEAIDLANSALERREATIGLCR